MDIDEFIRRRNIVYDLSGDLKEAKIYQELFLMES